MEHKHVLQKFKTTDGHTIKLDVSFQGCQPFGFFPGDKVITATGLKAIIKGTGLTREGDLALWYELLKNPGKVSYFGGSRNLRRAGFKKGDF